MSATAGAENSEEQQLPKHKIELLLSLKMGWVSNPRTPFLEEYCFHTCSLILLLFSR